MRCNLIAVDCNERARRDVIMPTGVQIAVKRIAGMAAGLWLAMTVTPAFAAEELVGTWQMIYQQIGSAHMAPLPVALRVTQANGALQFDYMVNKEMELTTTFTVRLDGTPGVINDGKGSAKGIAKIGKVSATEYKLVMQSPNKPPEPGKLILTDKGNILRCESDAVLPDRGPSHIIQVFARQTMTP